MEQSENRQSAAKLEWRTIAENTSYMVSNSGLVKSLKTNKILKFGNRSRYYTVSLSENGKMVTRYVHRLVALAFIPNPYNKRYVNHLDHNIKNNNSNNLEWCTASENARHSYEKNRRVAEYRTTRKEITEKMINTTKKRVVQYDLFGQQINCFESAAEASRQTKINSKGISSVCRGKRKTAGGFIWRFQEGSTTKCEGKPSSTAPNSETREDIV